VSLLTKTAFQALKIGRMYQPFREQARSHDSPVDQYICGIFMFDGKQLADTCSHPCDTAPLRPWS
jgi:hypothetical protein